MHVVVFALRKHRAFWRGRAAEVAVAASRTAAIAVGIVRLAGVSGCSERKEACPNDERDPVGGCSRTLFHNVYFFMFYMCLIRTERDRSYNHSELAATHFLALF